MGDDKLIVSVSGVRGTIGGTLGPTTACELACAFGKLLGRGAKVVLGRDTRPSGAMLRHAVTAGLLGSGVSVIDLGVVSTPGVALMTRRLHADGGVVITASHNPAEYNGIKFLQSKGWGLTAGMAEQLKELWQSHDSALADVEGQGSESADETTHEAHVAAVCGICDADAIGHRRFKVVLDSINGAGCVVTPMLLGRLGCELVHLNAEPNGRFAHRPEPVAENLGGLCEAVRANRAAVGFAQDPDADRLALVDENGRFIGEEYTLALAAAMVLRGRKGKLCTNLATSRMIDDIAAAAGAEVVRVPTGEANVVEAMVREGCIFGGEGSGGVIDPRVVCVRDSLVGMVLILQYMAETGRALSDLAAEIPAYVMLKAKLPCPAAAAAAVARRTRSAFESRRGVTFNDADGLRVDLPDGWVSVRASNTEPIMRMVAEARSRAAAEKLMAEVRQIAMEVLGKE